MSHSPFRFVHATNVRLDQPMWGIGTLKGDARRLAEEATNLAFEQIVDTCIKYEADVLLLTGNTIDVAHGPRARMVLEQACDQLAEHGCEVFLMPGESDPPHSWTSGAPMPSNLTVFLTDHAEPVPVVRDGVTRATIEPYHDRQHSITPSFGTGVRIGLIAANQHAQLQQLLAGDDGGPLNIKHLDRHPSLVNFSYLALGCGSERVTVQLPRGLAHDPGCPQPLDGRETSSLGCTLIETDGAGPLQTRLIPTPVVRREEIAVTVTAETDWDDLLTAMKSALLDRDPLPCERLWLTRWVIDGEGDVIGQLMEPSAQEELAELIEAELEDGQSILRVHEVELVARWSDSIDIAEAGSIFEEFNGLVDEHAAEHLAQFCRGLPARDWPEAAWVRHIIEAAEQATARNVSIHARNLSRRHLLGEPREVA